MKKASSGKKKWSLWVKIALILMILLALAGGITLFFVVAARTLFSANTRLTLSEIVVDSFSETYNGYWNPLSVDERQARKKELASYVRESAGAVEEPLPLFAFDLADVRKRIMLQNPEIQSLTIRRELPDRLVFSITERVPRAAIMNTGFYVDDAGMVMRSNKSQKIGGSLPWIAIPNASSISITYGDNVAEKPETGKILFSLKILEEFRKRSDIRVSAVRFVNDIAKPRIECNIVYGLPSRGERQFTLWLNPNLTQEQLANDIGRRLQPMLDIGMSRPDFSIIDLRFENMAKGVGNR